MAFRLEGLSPPAPMLPSTSLSTTPPAPTMFESAHELRQGWGSKTAPAGGRTTAGGDCCAARMSSLTHKAMSRLAIPHSTPCAAGINSILYVVAESVGTQAHDRHRKRVAKGLYPSQTWEIVSDPGREPHR